MACILHIETSTKACSVALSENGSLIFHKEDIEGPNHSVVCGVFVDEALSFANSHAIPVDAVAVSEGPGSYTGLRIGVSLAKGVCYGRDLPLLSVPTLKLLCVPVLLGKEELPEDALLIPMIDARRMEVYATIFDTSLNVLRNTSADIVDANSYLNLLSSNKVAFFGNGSEKCKEVITHPNAIFIEDIHPLASAMGVLAEKAFSEKDFVDSAYFEPLYLKEFVATTPKNKII